MKKRIALIIFSFLFHLSGYYALRYKIEPFQYFFYIVSWWSYIVFIDTVLSLKENKFIILNRGLPVLIIISCSFWCIFEIINVRIQNWFYISLPQDTYRRYAGYLLAYGTVIPAIYVTRELMLRFVGASRTTPFSMRHYPAYSIPLGTISLLLTYLYPSYCFALTWVFLALILDGYNYAKGYGSFMGDFEKGLTGNMIATLLSGLVCGALWEAWNFRSVSKWVYTVPFFENMKIFEMPVLGYIGFPIFSLEVVAFVNFLKGVGLYGNACGKTFNKRLYAAALASLIFSLFSFSVIDRYTVFSYAPRIEELAFITRERLDRFAAEGAETSYGVNTDLLNDNEKEKLNLLHLKGLGTAHFSKLKRHGIQSIDDFSRLDEETLSRILNEDNVRRVRVYMKAAREAVK